MDISPPAVLDEDGNWVDLTQQYNSSSDISPTAGQMPRLLGLAQASKVYKEVSFEGSEKFSNDGNEVAWGTIGNASTSEGLFFETINAAGVLQVPMVISIWDDEYGISVGAEYQTTKEDISEILKGISTRFQREWLRHLRCRSLGLPCSDQYIYNSRKSSSRRARSL